MTITLYKDDITRLETMLQDFRGREYVQIVQFLSEIAARQKTAETSRPDPVNRPSIVPDQILHAAE